MKYDGSILQHDESPPMRKSDGLTPCYETPFVQSGVFAYMRWWSKAWLSACACCAAYGAIYVCARGFER